MNQISKEVTRLFYPVKKVLAKDYAPSLTFPSGMSHLIIAPEQDNLVLTSCSEIYELITNKELIMPFYDRMKNGHDLEVKIRNWDYASFKLDFIFKDQQMKKKKVGGLFSRVSMINSYDRSRKYQFDCGFYRLVCSNGASVPTGEVKQFKLMHTPAAGNDVALNETIKGIESFLIKAENIVDAYDPLIENKLRMAQAEARIQELVEEKIFPTRSVDVAMNRLRLEVNQGEELTDFLVYNAMNYALNNNPESKTSANKIDKTDQQVLDYMLAN